MNNKTKKSNLAEIVTTTYSNICEKNGISFYFILEKSFSKYEQTSNWAIRPLRRAQIHYAALDAYVLVRLFLDFKELLEKQVR